MTDLSTDLKNSIGDLQTRHASLLTAVQAYRNGNVGVSKADITAATAALAARVDAEESTLLGLAGKGVQPSLSLDFLGDMYLMGENRPTKGYQFSDLVTFSRASAAWYYNSAGVLTQAAANAPRFNYDPVTKALRGLLIEEQRTNLLTYSSSLDNSAWARLNVSVTPNVLMGMDGLFTADRITPTAVNSEHYIERAASSVAPGTYTFSAFVKDSGFGSIRLRPTHSGDTSATSDITFNFAAKTLTASNGRYISSGFVELPNGVFRVWITFSTSVTTTPSGRLQLGSGYVGDPALGAYVWGAQLEAGAFPTSYIPSADTFTSRATTATYLNSAGTLVTAAVNAARSSAYAYDSTGALQPVGLLLEAANATNLALYSDQFDNAAWSKVGVSVTPNASVAPDGSMSADKLITSSGSSTVGASIVQSVSKAASPVTYTASVFVKAGEMDRVRLFLHGANTSTARCIADFNLVTKSASILNQGTSGFDDATATIVEVGGGYFRVSLTATTDSNSGVSLRIYSISSSISTGDGNSGIYIWGAQLEGGSVPTSYIPTTSAQVTRAADVSSSAQVTRAMDDVRVNTLAPWFNAREGSMTAEWDAVGGVNNTPVVLLQGVSSNCIRIRNDPDTTKFDVVTDSAVISSRTAGAAPATWETRKAAIAYKEADYAIAVAGGAASAGGGAGRLPTVSHLRIGTHIFNTQGLNGHIRKLRYYPKRLTNTQLQAVTA